MTITGKTKDNKAQEKYKAALDECLKNRRLAYQRETDGMFFDYQRGAAKQKDWEDAVEAVKVKFPKPKKSDYGLVE